MTTVAATAHLARRRILLAISAMLALLALAFALYWWLVLNHSESTDDAYVQGDVVEITPQVSGTVVALNVQDTDVVKAGQRSEEHTSELQSLMRSSYAVFCLKKKK